MGKVIEYSKKELAWIEKNKTLSRKELTQKFNKLFNRNISIDNIKGLCTRKGWKTGRTGMFAKGKESWNKGKKGLYTGGDKGWFKKGHTPHNHLPVGSKRYDSKDHYEYIKIADPNQWRQSHYLIWEEYHGKVKEGCLLRFIDGDKTNITIENIEMISKCENVRLNQMDYANTPDELKPTVKLIAKVQAKAGEIADSRHASDT